MTPVLEKAQGIIVAGVGGQGAITLAQLILGAAWKSDYYCLQSEVHGMSQRGGAVNAHIVFDSAPVTSPTIMEGAADVLIGMEPLETLRYIHMVKQDGNVISSTSPLVNMPTYPDESQVISAINEIDDIHLVDTDECAKTLKNRHAGNVVLLGMASKFLPMEQELWHSIFEERFKTKGEKIIHKNVEAFTYGRNLINS